MVNLIAEIRAVLDGGPQDNLVISRKVLVEALRSLPDDNGLDGKEPESYSDGTEWSWFRDTHGHDGPSDLPAPWFDLLTGTWGQHNDKNYPTREAAIADALAARRKL